MKRYKALSILLAGSVFLGAGCKKFLDINKDPNNPLAVSESLQLGPIEFTTSSNIVGGFTGTTTAYWMQYISINQPSPDAESYFIQPADVDNTWTFFLYPNTFEALNLMIAQAEAAGHNQYVAIGKTLFAFNLAITTDMWNDIPYSQALQITTIRNPKYDSQETVYGGIQSLLDSALYYINQPASITAPSTDDFIFGGNMAAWQKFIYMLKARYYLRLSAAPGRTAATQADSALTALQNAFASNGDNAAVAYPGTQNGQSAWYANTAQGTGGVVVAASFVDSLVTRNDPRLAILVDTNDAGGYSGRQSGASTGPDPNAYSSINSFYGGYLPLLPPNAQQPGAAAPLYLGTYSEQLFIQAEATFLTQGAAAATPIYKAAIAAHMSLLGVSQTAAQNYINNRPALTAANAIQQIINEKYVAGFLSIEPYNDWRRTGFPVLTLAQNAYVNYIPRRWPYSSTEILANPQPEQQGITTQNHVWWDTRP